MSWIRGVVVTCALFALVAKAFAGPNPIEFRFAGLFPFLSQPWYYRSIYAIRRLPPGFVVVCSRGNVQTLTASGQVVRQWVRSGSGESRLSLPLDCSPDVFDFITFIDSDAAGSPLKRFSSSGAHANSFGVRGTGVGQLDQPKGLARSAEGLLFVVDQARRRVLIYGADDGYIGEFGADGSGNGEFLRPIDIHIDGQNQVLVADSDRNDVQYFDITGAHQRTIAMPPDRPIVSITTDPRDNRLLASSGAFGTFVVEFNQAGFPLGESTSPTRLHTVDHNGTRLFIDSDGIGRVSDLGGVLESFSSQSTADNRLSSAFHAVAEPGNSTLVLDEYGEATPVFKRFSESGQHQATIRPFETADFALVKNFAVSSAGEIAVLLESLQPDPDLCVMEGACLYFLNSSGVSADSMTIFSDTPPVDGTVVSSPFASVERFYSVIAGDPSPFNGVDEIGAVTWYGRGANPGGGGWSIPLDENDPLYFDVFDVAGMDGDGNLIAAYADFASGNAIRFKRFSPAGSLLQTWLVDGSMAPADSVLNLVEGPDGSIVMAYTLNGTETGLYAFSADGAFQGKLAAGGISPGQLQFDSGRSMSFSPSGLLHVADGARVSRFELRTLTRDSVAVIIAGGGPYPGNSLWPATELAANQAYRALAFQGFNRDTIYYLSENATLDLDLNPELAEVDAPPTAASIEDAIGGDHTAGAQNLLLYMVDHGGDERFRVSGQEVLEAMDLRAWLDNWQAAVPGRSVTLIYDACQSGTFLQPLSVGSSDRVVLTSTQPEQDAYFLFGGSVSFSSLLFTEIAYGQSLGEALSSTRAGLQVFGDAQQPLADTDGDGIQSASDQMVLDGLYLGTVAGVSVERPVITSVSDPQFVTDGAPAVLEANGVTGEYGIARVWAVIRPPSFVTQTSGNAVLDLRVVDLQPIGGDTHRASVDELPEPGTYVVGIYAADGLGNTTGPVSTSIEVANPKPRKAVLAALGASTDPAAGAYRNEVEFAYSALAQQGFQPDFIQVLSDASLIADAPLSSSSLQDAITVWASDADRLVIYLTGPGVVDGVELPEGTLDWTTVDGWIDTYQSQSNGLAVVIVDVDQGESAIPALATSPGQPRRVVMSSTRTGQASHGGNGGIGFSRYFWNQVLYGADLRSAYETGRRATQGLAIAQASLIDDNGNGIPNEILDGLFARSVFLGTGVLIAGNSPLIGSLSPPSPVLQGNVELTVTVDDITSTIAVSSVVGQLLSPSGSVREIAFFDPGSGRFEGLVDGLGDQIGDYRLVVHAFDSNGAVSPGVEMTITQTQVDGLFSDGFEDSL